MKAKETLQQATRTIKNNVNLQVTSIQINEKQTQVKTNRKINQENENETKR